MAYFGIRLAYFGVAYFGCLRTTCGLLRHVVGGGTPWCGMMGLHTGSSMGHVARNTLFLHTLSLRWWQSLRRSETTTLPAL